MFVAYNAWSLTLQHFTVCNIESHKVSAIQAVRVLEEFEITSSWYSNKNTS